MKLLVSSVFTYFECYAHIFATISFWFNNKVLEAVYYYNFTELFWAIFFSSNQRLHGDSFGKVFLLHYHPVFPNFFKCDFYYRLNMMIIVALVPLKIFFVKMNFVLFRIKINQKSWFCVFKSSHSHSYTLCYICINRIFLTSFLIINCLLLFIWKLINWAIYVY